MNSDLLQLRTYLQRATIRPAGGREIEARWGVTKAQFYQVMQKLTSEPPRREFYRDTAYPSTTGRLRRREVFERAETTGSSVSAPLRIEWTLKEVQGQPYISKDFGYLVSVATETTVPVSQGKAGDVRSSYRSSVLAVDGLQIDFIEEVAPAKYRIEAELVGGSTELLVEWVPRILSLIQQSHIPISLSERAAVIK